MPEPDERDEIAGALADSLNIVGPLRHIFGAHSTSKELLDALDVLLAQEIETLAAVLTERDAERDRRTAAQAWDEGYMAGQGSMLVSAGGEPHTNPYSPAVGRGGDEEEK